MNDQNKHMNRSANNCISAAELIAYQKGELSVDEMYKVEMHALECPLCADALEGFAEPGAEKALADLDEMFAASNLVERSKEKKPGFITTRQLISIAAVLCVFIAGVYLFDFAAETSRERMMTDNASPVEKTNKQNAVDHKENSIEKPEVKSDGSAKEKSIESTVKIVEQKPTPASIKYIYESEAESDNNKASSDVISIVDDSKKETPAAVTEKITTGNATTASKELKKTRQEDSANMDSELLERPISLSEVTVTQQRSNTKSVPSTESISSKDQIESQVTFIKNKLWNITISNGNAIAGNTSGNLRINIFTGNTNPVFKREKLSLVGSIFSYSETIYDQSNTNIVSRHIIAKDLNKKGNPASLTVLFTADDIYSSIVSDKKLSQHIKDTTHTNLNSLIASFDTDCKTDFSSILNSYSIVKVSGNKALVKFGLPGKCAGKFNQYTEFRIWIPIDSSRISIFEEAASLNNLER